MDLSTILYDVAQNDIDASAIEQMVVTDVTSKGCVYENACEYDRDKCGRSWAVAVFA